MMARSTRHSNVVASGKDGKQSAATIRKKSSVPAKIKGNNTKLKSTPMPSPLAASTRKLRRTATNSIIQTSNIVMTTTRNKSSNRSEKAMKVPRASKASSQKYNKLGKAKTAVKIKSEKVEVVNHLDEASCISDALKNVKTEVKVENKEYHPSGEFNSLQNMSPLVHAADGRSRHNLVDGKRPFRIPPHLLGRNLNDPASDVVAGSRRPLQKPRLGVKIPYRNLTSQIVTHEELTRELLERSKRKTAALDDASGNSSEGSNAYFFTMKLMARLAHRLPNPHFPELSGYRPAKPKPPPKDNLGYMRPGCSIDPDMEREIALKQLEELPSKRKGRGKMTRQVEFTRIHIKSEPPLLTPQQVALKQLEEIQIRKPKTEYAVKDNLSKPLQAKLMSKLKMQHVTLHSMNGKGRESGTKLTPIKLSQLCKNDSKKSSSTRATSTRSVSKPGNGLEVTKTRFSSRLKR